MIFSKFFYGADYYPEHWPEERWQEDARLMAEAGFNIVRLAEFAWSKMEPEEGRFDFEWLDQAIEILAAWNIDVVLGTPTASPPPWLMAKQEDLFMVKENGIRLGYGNRREYCPNNPLYHKHTEKIVKAMADHYQDHPRVIGWQIDNEFGARCFCDICKIKFHEWLKDKYETLDELNNKWGTFFWSHIYNEWSEIPIPVRLGNTPMDSSPNPGLALDYFRFMSDTYVAYQDLQIGILRKKCPKHFITHNFMGFKYPLLNYFDLAKDLDFVSWDNYCRMQWTMGADVNPSAAALNHDAMRGLNKKNFWVMEQQSGPGGWEHVSAPTKPGELRLWAYQSIAHGADGIVFFRWRTCRFGTEEYWHGVLDHHGIPGRRYEEISKMGDEIKRIGDLILGSKIKPAVAMMQSYDSRFALKIQQVNPKLGYEEHFGDFYQAFHNQNIPVDVISENDMLSTYKLVVVPTMYVLRDETVENLERFAEEGGIVVFTGLTGAKDENNAVVNMKLPGLAAKMCGLELEEYVSLPLYEENEIRFSSGDFEDEFPVPIWAEVLELRTALPLAHFCKDFIVDKTAAAINSFGQGKVIYLGALGGKELYDGLVRWLVLLVGIEVSIDAPTGVEVMERWRGDRKITFILNHTQNEQQVQLDGSYQDLIADKSVRDKITIQPLDVMILKC
jgi:beta-galactosidase